MTNEEIVRDALNKINHGHYNNACGQLRLLLEKYLKQLCANNPGVHPENDNNAAMIYALSKSGIIDPLTRSKLLNWKTLGNAGAHPDSPSVEKMDAEHFLNGIAKLLNININLTPAIQTEIEQQPSIENLHTSITKTQAIEIINEKTEFRLNDKNCGFSNINKRKPVWWLDPAINKFEDDFFIVLNNCDKNSLYLFKLPAKTIKPQETFRLKKDKQVSIEIKADNIDQFTDIKSGGKNFQFKKFLIKTICY